VENLMKRFALTSLSLALLGTAGAAHAQSSVTLYGVIDEALAYVNHASGNNHLVGLSAGNLSGDRWGLKGSEDLGGGLKAIFQLENGFNVNTGALGQNSREFGRQAFVGLTSDKLGTVTLGRQYDPLVDMVQGITGDNYWASIVGTPGDVDNYDNSSRVNNAVKYVSPNYAGLQFEGMYGFSNGAGTTGQGQTWSGAVAYNVVRFDLRQPDQQRVRVGSLDRHRSCSSSVHYRRGNVRRFVQQCEVSSGRFLGILVDRDVQHWQRIRELPAYAGFPDRHGLHVRESEWRHGCSLQSGADYTLSKRTDFYALGAYQKASGTQATFTTNAAGQTVRVNQQAQASIGSFGFAGTSTQEMVLIGIRHKF
jgi:predicted porin